jgi:hypothetical protein
MLTLGVQGLNKLCGGVEDSSSLRMRKAEDSSSE